ncbi:hypothetical protein [Caulobacter sp. BK020]|uniref:hypothetical protein n=1 Tax=Caulobacter sp. BK020 TaxID=2512117 RepID=UPI001047AB35|nr:hypothetical protein [Caulobacter sp. BK020]
MRAAGRLRAIESAAAKDEWPETRAPVQRATMVGDKNGALKPRYCSTDLAVIGLAADVMSEQSIASWEAGANDRRQARRHGWERLAESRLLEAARGQLITLSDL